MLCLPSLPQPNAPISNFKMKYTWSICCLRIPKRTTVHQWSKPKFGICRTQHLAPEIFENNLNSVGLEELDQLGFERVWKVAVSQLSVKSLSKTVELSTFSNHCGMVRTHWNLTHIVFELHQFLRAVIKCFLRESSSHTLRAPSVQRGKIE